MIGTWVSAILALLRSPVWLGQAPLASDLTFPALGHKELEGKIPFTLIATAIPKCGARVSLATPQKRGISPSLCKSHACSPGAGPPPGQQARSVQEGGAALQEGPHALLLQRSHQPLIVQPLEQKLHGSDCDPGRRWDHVIAQQHPPAPVAPTMPQRDKHCTQVCESGSQRLPGLVLGAKTEPANSENRNVLDTSEGLL